MKKRIILTVILIVYSAILIKVMVFKDLPLIRVGSMRFKFGGTHEGPANFLPFKTILPYLLGDKGLMIAVINLAGNIVLLVPIGFLVPFVYQNITWKKSLALAVAVGFAIEGMQALFHVGIFVLLVAARYGFAGLRVNIHTADERHGEQHEKCKSSFHDPAARFTQCRNGSIEFAGVATALGHWSSSSHSCGRVAATNSIPMVARN